jgi:heavy metal sensor kinase
LASGLIVNGILQAIKVISDSTKQIEKNNLKYRINNLYNTPEIDELILTLNEMLDRIESGFEKISQFSSDVSHELKTPLASIKGMIEVELSNNRTIEDYKETMIRVLEECNWLISIINDLLLLTRIEAEKEERRFKKINITKLIGEICELLSLIAEENSVKIIFKEEKAIYINGDSDKLKRMILNLISNAVKYNKHDGFIKIRIKENSDIVIIEVEDSGIGIKKENIEKVFERFYREDKIRTTKKSGSGLGLSIADTIVKFHNGKIIIESEEGEATIIKVELPKN